MKLLKINDRITLSKNDLMLIQVEKDVDINDLIVTGEF